MKCDTRQRKQKLKKKEFKKHIHKIPREDENTYSNFKELKG